MIRNTLRTVILSFLLSCFVAFGFSAWYFWSWLQTPVSIPEEYRHYAIEKGDSLHKVSLRLQQQGILKWPKVFIAYAKQTGSTQINVGEFALGSEESPISLLELFQSNNFIQYKLTVVEGSTAAEFVSALKKLPRVEKLIQQPFDTANSKLEGIEQTHLEGWFYPDTYFYSSGDTDLSIMQRAHSKLREVLQEEWQQRAGNLPYASPYEALIMASIIEKETGAPHERAEIAGVFVRRLEKGMRLQTDPTVIYGLTREWDGNITRKDLKTDHPYNTYRINGLPPTPIALVGREAIHAALHPADGSALYFVAKGDGTHYFSDTHEEHREAVKRFQLNRKENYRSNYR